MNKFLVDLFPVFLFFVAFKYYGIYVATWVGILTTFGQVVYHRAWYKQWDKMQLMTLLIFILFGGMTLYFHNPIFVKWKPTILFWIFASVLLFSHFFSPKPLMSQLLESAFKESPQALPLPLTISRKLNMAWVLFFLSLGAANLYVAYYFDDKIWVNFKFYGITGITLVFSILQTILLAHYLKEND